MFHWGKLFVWIREEAVLCACPRKCFFFSTLLTKQIISLEIKITLLMPWNSLDTWLAKAQDTVVTYKEQQLFWNHTVSLFLECFVMLGIKPRTWSMPTSSLYLSGMLCPCVLSCSGESLFEITVVEGWACRGRETWQARLTYWQEQGAEHPHPQPQAQSKDGELDVVIRGFLISKPAPSDTSPQQVHISWTPSKQGHQLGEGFKQWKLGGATLI